MAITVLDRRIIPALSFAAATTNVVNCGTGTATSNMVSGSTLCLVYPTLLTGGDRYLWSRSQAGALNSFRQADGWIRRFISLSGTDFNVGADNIAFPHYQPNQWSLLGCTWKAAGAVSDQKILHGDAHHPMQEALSYSAMVVGTGTPTTEAAASMRIGNHYTGSVALGGSIHTMLIIRDYLMTTEEFQRVGKLMLAQVPLHNAIKGIGAAGLWYPGRNGTGTVYDESGNGNHGTITGAVQVNGPPIPRLRQRLLVGATADSYFPRVPPRGMSQAVHRAAHY